MMPPLATVGQFKERVTAFAFHVYNLTRRVASFMRKQPSVSKNIDIASATEQTGGSAHEVKIVVRKIWAINNGSNTLQMGVNLRRAVQLKRTFSENFRRREKWCLSIHKLHKKIMYVPDELKVVANSYLTCLCEWQGQPLSFIRSLFGIVLGTRKSYYAEI